MAPVTSAAGIPSCFQTKRILRRRKRSTRWQIEVRRHILYVVLTWFLDQLTLFSHPTVDRSDSGDGGWVFADEGYFAKGIVGSSPPSPHLNQYEIRQAGDTSLIIDVIARLLSIIIEPQVERDRRGGYGNDFSIWQRTTRLGYSYCS